MSDSISVYDLLPAKDDSAKPKKTGGIKVADLTKPQEKVAPKPITGPLTQYASQAKDVTKTALKSFMDDPEGTTLAAGVTLFRGAVSMFNTAASGVAALAKTMVQAPPGQNIDTTLQDFSSNQKKIQSALDGVNKAPMLPDQERAMQDLLNLIPAASQAVGDSVFEKTGSALAGTGALSLATVLTLSPDVAAKTFGKVRGTAKGGQPGSKISAAFDEMAAKHPEAAEKVADHIEQVDPQTAKYLKRRIQKFIDASDKELSIIGKNAADAAIAELEGDFEKIRPKPSTDEGLSTGEGVGRYRKGRRPGPADPLIPDQPKPKPTGGSPSAPPTPRTNNASGESAASAEAISRVAEEKAKGQDRFVLHADDTVTPLTGVDAVDAKARPGDVIVQRGVGKDPYTVLDRGGLSQGLAQGRLNRAVGLGTLQLKPVLTAEQVGSTIRTAAKEGTESIARMDMSMTPERRAIEREGVAARRDREEQASRIKQFPKQTVPGSAKDFVTEVQEGTGTTKMKDQLSDPRKLASYLSKNASVAEAWDMNYIRENWKATIEHAPGYDYAWEVHTPWKTTHFKTELEARQFRKNEQARVDKEIERQAAKRKEQGIPDDQSVTEFNNNKREESKGGQPLYISSGIPITRQMVESAFTFAADAVEKIPGFKIARSKMESLYNTYIETFNPEAKGAPARTAGAAIARNFFEQARREHQTWEAGKQRRVYWQKMGPKASMDFINAMETSKPLTNPIWEKARAAYKNWTAEMVAQDQRTYAGSGKDLPYEPRENYVPHLFEDGEGVIRWATKKYGNKWADPRFIKDRSFNLYQEAIYAGFTPKYTNPEEIMQARQFASDIAALRTDLLADLERKGVAVKAAKGADRPPPGFSPNSRRSPTGVRYWVRDEADALMHNAFDSASLWNLQGSSLKRAVSSGFRGWMGVKNALIPIKLGLSLFHPMHVLHIDASATLARETKGLLGDPSASSIKSFMLNSATAYLQPLWTNPKIGYPILKVFQGKRDFASLSDGDKAAFRDLAEGGMVPTRPREETSGSIQRMKDAINKRSAVAVFHLPFAALAAVSHPLFGVWIPELKIASYLKDVKVARELNPNWTDSQRQEAFRQIARKVEARYGEMNYNSLFMDKMLKDIGVATNLSLGWNIGLLDQYVGGAIDLGKASKRIGLDILDPESRGSEVKRQLAAGTMDRPVFAAYYVGTALIIGGLMHYFFTGQQPKQLIDYTHPQSGEKDQYGKPIRLNTMFYTREFEGLYKHMQDEGVMPGLSEFIKNKGSGLMEMSRTALTGVDSLGQDIRNPEDPAYKQFEQTLFNTLTGLDPISVEAIEKSTGSSAKNVALSVTGFTPAGKYISETVIEGQIADRFNRFVRPKEKPFQAVEMAKDVKELRKDFLNDNPKYDDKLEAAIKKYDLTDKDIHKLEKLFNSPKEAEFDPSVYMFQKLPWEVQKPLLDKMTPEERETYLPHISKAKRQKYERETEGAT
jgi:hypothetical protein